MKHGDKEKGKASKASGKKSSSKAGAPGKSKAVPRAEAKKQAASAGKKAAAVKARPEETGGNGKARPRAGGDGGGFTNPLVAAAFKRAVKKYPNTFRKLSD